MPSVHISFEISLDDIGHPLCEFRNSTSTDTIHIYESFMIELIDEGKRIPEEISDFELQFVMICFGKTLADLSYLILRSIDVV